ncbi:cis-Golgi t-SNARE syntaxin [Entomortierella chlamydospora]|nr:cis-Golgi t-SNARE syntaxin [Entomortierella chlamydospora]
MDRTAEFKAAVNSLLNRGQIQSSRQHHYTNANSPARKGKEAAAYAEFSKLASSIGQDIGETSTKLEKLTKCKFTWSKERLSLTTGLSRSQYVSITSMPTLSDLLAIADLSRLNAQTMALQQHVRSTAAKANRFTRQMDEHSTSLVIILQSRLANISMGFKEALEIRTEQQQQGQSLQLPQTGILSSLRNTTRSPIGLVPTSASPPQPPNQYNNYGNNNIPQNGRMSPFMQPPPSRSPSSLSQHQHQQQYLNGSTEVEPYSSSSVHRRKGRVDDYHGQQQYEDDSESAGPASMLFQQQQHAPHVEQHIQNRSSAIEAVESTLQELGGIFQQLAQMVAEQRDTIQRIEANADDIELNINEAQNQLLRYYRNISSDRWLMIKIFLTIIFVFLVVSLVS